MHDPQVKFSEFMQARNSLDHDASKMRIDNNADDDAHVTGDSSSSSSSSKPQQLHHQQQPSWWDLNDRLDDDNRLDAPIPQRERVVSVHNATLAVGHLLRARHSAYAVEAGLARMRKSHHLVARTMFMEMFLSDDEASNVAFSALRRFLGMVQDEKGGAESCLHVGTRVNGTSTEPAKVADYLDVYRQTSEALVQDHEKDGCSHRFAPPGVYERILREFKKGGRENDIAIRMCVNSDWLVKTRIRTPANWEWTDAVATWRRDMNP